MNSEQAKIMTSQSSEVANVTDTFYQSESKQISVTTKQVSMAKGSATVYIADVTLSDATSLQSAFAKNAFGANIVEPPSTIAQNNNAVFAINADYYGFRDDGIIIRNGIIHRDKGARTGLAIYKNGTMKTYGDTKTIVLGDRRFVGKVPFRNKLGNKLTAGLFKIATEITIHDTQTGLRAFSTKLIDWLVSLKGNRFEYEFNMLLEAKQECVKLVEETIQTIYIEKISNYILDQFKTQC